MPEMPPLLGPVSQVLGIANIAYGIYKSNDAKQFNAHLTSQLAAMQQDIKDITHDLSLILAKLDNLKVWGTALGNPINYIHALQDIREKGSPIADSQYVQLNMNMTYLNEVACATYLTAAATGSAADIYMNVVTNQGSNPHYIASNLEQLYSYFSGIIIANMMAGYQLLGSYELHNPEQAEKFKYYETWHNSLTQVTPATKDAPAQDPLLIQQGKKFQECVDGKIKDKIEWTNAGETDNIVDGDCFQTYRICMDGSANIPDGHVITGFWLATDEDNCMVLEVSHGLMNKYGFVTPIDTCYNIGGGDILSVQNASSPDHPDHKHFAVVYTGPVLPPDDNSVITDICWHVQSGTEHTTDGRGKNVTLNIDYFYLSIKTAPVHLVEGDVFLGAPGDWSPHPDLKSSDWIRFELDDHENITCLQWRKNGDWSKLWNTPMTGLRYNQRGNVAATTSFRTSIHTKAFGYVLPEVINATSDGMEEGFKTTLTITVDDHGSDTDFSILIDPVDGNFEHIQKWGSNDSIPFQLKAYEGPKEVNITVDKTNTRSKDGGLAFRIRATNEAGTIISRMFEVSV